MNRMPDAADASGPSPTSADKLSPPTRKQSQFSIRQIMLWTAIVAVGAVVGTLSQRYRLVVLTTVLPIYVVSVFGIVSTFRDPKSVAVWLTTAMNLFTFTFFFRWFFVVSGTMGGWLDLSLLRVPCLLGALPYGIGLLVTNVHRIKRGNFSLSVLLYHLSSWLVWIAFWDLISSSPPFSTFFWGAMFSS
jgi:hypothetical protein